jgi:hypothetical protein
VLAGRAVQTHAGPSTQGRRTIRAGTARRQEPPREAEGKFLIRDVLIVQGTKAVVILRDGRVQLGTQSPPLMASAALAQLSKGDARKLRKASALGR